jgi:hypothetical protein
MHHIYAAYSPIPTEVRHDNALVVGIVSIGAGNVYSALFCADQDCACE